MNLAFRSTPSIHRLPVRAGSGARSKIKRHVSAISVAVLLLACNAEKDRAGPVNDVGVMGTGEDNAIDRSTVAEVVSAEAAVQGKPDGVLLRGEALARVETDQLELTVVSVDFREDYGGAEAPSGRRFVVIGLEGRSLSQAGLMSGSAVHFDPTESIWLVSDGGYLHPALMGATDGEPGLMRFAPDGRTHWEGVTRPPPPEVLPRREVAALVPEGTEALALGLRLGNDVVTVPVTEVPPAGPPDPLHVHTDGNAMEVLLFGQRRQGELVVVNLGIRPLVERSGLEIQTTEQFFLVAAEGEHRVDLPTTGALPYGVAEEFVVPPGTAVRFEVAFRSDHTPVELRFRGFRSEARLPL